MNKECIHCGLPFQLYTEGSLYIEFPETAALSGFTKFDHAWLKADYFSVHELENLLRLAAEKIQPQKTAGITRLGETPLLTSTLAELKSRVEEREIVEVIHDGPLVSHLQPIISLKQEDALFGYESLLRTESSNPVPPGRLFGIANQTGLLSLLDRRAREAAIKARKEMVPDGIKSFVNFLPSTIYNPNYCLQHTFSLVEKYQIDPGDLVFEVVESEEIEDIDHLKQVLETYKKQGMKVALDDVGAGFSTLEVLEMLKPDFVKIDRKFISYCDENEENQEFLGRVIDLAKQMGVTVLAEGIERKEELEYCRGIGVDLAQGYYIGKPSIQPAFQLVK